MGLSERALLTLALLYGELKARLHAGTVLEEGVWLHETSVPDCGHHCKHNSVHTHGSQGTHHAV